MVAANRVGTGLGLAVATACMFLFTGCGFMLRLYCREKQKMILQKKKIN